MLDALYCPDLFLEPRLGTTHRLGPSWYLPASAGRPLIAAGTMDHGDASWRLEAMSDTYDLLPAPLKPGIASICEIRRSSQRRSGAHEPAELAKAGGNTADADTRTGRIRFHDSLVDNDTQRLFASAVLAHEAMHVLAGSYNAKLTPAQRREWRTALMADMRHGRRLGRRLQPLAREIIPGRSIYLHLGPIAQDPTDLGLARHLRLGGPWLSDYVAVIRANSIRRIAAHHREKARDARWVEHWVQQTADAEDLACAAGYWQLSRLSGELFDGFSFERLYPFRAAVLGRWLAR